MRNNILCILSELGGKHCYVVFPPAHINIFLLVKKLLK